MHRNGKSKNLIWIFAVLVLLTVLSAVGVKGAFPDAIALEQAPRCGMEEHVHGEECYVGDILVCREKMHAHGQNCYLVLLEDNDINELLTRVDATEDNSLETLISFTVLRAAPTAQLNTNVEHAGPVASVSPSPSVSPTVTPSLIPSMTPSLIPTLSPSPSVSPSADPESTPSASPSQSVTANQPLSVTQQAQPITNRQIAALNAVSDTSVTGVVLNEHLVAYNLSETASEEELLASLLAGGSGSIGSGTITVPTPGTLTENAGASTLAVPEEPVTSGRTANFYIWLDKTGFVCVGSIPLNNSNPDYAAKSEIVDLLNTGEIISDIAAADIETGNSAVSGIQIRYSLSQPGSDAIGSHFDNDGNRVGSNGANANRIGFGNTGSPRYATVMTGSGYGNSVSYSPINFYTVTLDYSQSGTTTTNKVQYVQSGQKSTFTLDTAKYDWYDEDDNPVTSLPTTITEKTTLYARPKVRTVTFNWNYDGAAEPYEKYDNVTPGSSVNAPTDPIRDNYSFEGWYGNADCTGAAYTFPLTVNSNLTLYAKWVGVPCDVTYKDGNGTDIKADETVEYNSTITLPEGYDWTDGNGKTYNGGTTVTITKDTNFVGTIKTYTVTIIDEDGNETTQTVEHGKTVDLAALPDGYVWLGNDGSVYNGGETSDPITSNFTFTATNRVVVIYDYKDDTKNVTQTYTPGTEITLPDLSGTNVWVDEGGNVYHGGDKITLGSNKRFSEQETLRITYNVNFYNSTGLGSDDYWSPVLAGTEVTTDTVTVIEGETVALYSVDPRAYVSEVNKDGSNTIGEAAYFEGWVPAADGAALLAPGTRLTWDVLQQYGVDGTVALTGKWIHDSSNNATDVRFFVRFDSVAPDVGGSIQGQSSSYYTDQIYLAYAGNYPTSDFSDYQIADKTADNSYTADQTIRALVGDKGDGTLWISGVPDDVWLLEQLETYTKENQTAEEIAANKYLRVYVKDSNGNEVLEDVLASELDTEHYSIRWYVFKKEGDGWHVDGRLVKKQGVITVDKVFGGAQDAIEQARDGFYILAENGEYDSDTETFTPYSDTDGRYKAYILVLNPAASTADGQKLIEEAEAAHPKAAVKIIDSEQAASGEIVDGWQITSVPLGEYWRFTEYVTHPTYENAAGNTVNYSWYAEYTVIDSDGESSRVAEFGSQATVIGKTYALDKDATQGLTVDFTNYYYDSDSILIRKIDGDTGLPLGGAEFQLWQGGLQLKFTDIGGGIYNVDPAGTIGSIVTNSEGFSVITIKDFSYSAGDLVVKEVTAPSGYAVVNDITIGYLNGTDGEAGIKSIVGAEPDQFNYHAEYHDKNGGVLIVKDHASHYTSVTVDKVWEGAAKSDSVEISLLANGANATLLFPTLANSQVVLSDETGWAYTWTALPTYANGELVEWSVKEIKIGTDTTMVGSDTFASWIVSYSAPVKTYDAEGNVENWAYTVTNTVRRTLIYLTKVDNFGAAIPGVQFTLTPVEEKDGAWSATGEMTLTATTDETGRILFDNLHAGTYYRLSEDISVAGYFPVENIVISIDGVGVVTQAVIDGDGNVTKVEMHTNTHQYTNPYNIMVVNTSGVELPATGGSGTLSYTLGGALLMAAALLMLYKKSRRKEDAPYV